VIKDATIFVLAAFGILNQLRGILNLLVYQVHHRQLPEPLTFPASPTLALPIGDNSYHFLSPSKCALRDTDILGLLLDLAGRDGTIGENVIQEFDRLASSTGVFLIL
jgi:hypothetical protein